MSQTFMDDNFNTIKIYIKIFGNINAIIPESGGWTLLHYAITFSSDINIVKYLLDNGADFNIKNGLGFSPLDKINDRLHIKSILELRKLLIKYIK